MIDRDVATVAGLAGRDFATVSEAAQILRADPRTITCVPHNSGVLEVHGA